MAYLKPPWFTARVFNRVAMATGISGSATLTVTRRSTGAEQRIPVIAVTVGGSRYLVSTRGESQWVRNVRAAPRVTLTTAGATSPYLAAEIPADQRTDVLAAYRAVAGKTVDGYFRSLPDPADHPVFLLTPA
jgi:deazaflavin-dependent oxidoreductase (nitroreductase family)